MTKPHNKLFVTLRAGAAAIDRAWTGKRSTWNKLAAWTWTIGHAPKAPLATETAKPEHV